MSNNWYKKIALFLSSQAISLFGSSLVQYAIMWYITLNTQSGVMMTVSVICGFLPTLFLSPFAGVWADRYNRKALVILSDLMIATVTLILAVLFLLGYRMMWLLFIISTVRALGAAVQMPAVNAIIPQLVPADKLTKVNAINGSIQSLVTLISPMISGVLLTISPIETIFFIDVVTAAVAILILICFLNIPAHRKADGKQVTGYFSDMLAGVNYIIKHDYLKSFFLFFALFMFLITPAAFLTPLQVTRSFGSDVWRLTLLEIVFSVGMMVGGIIMSLWEGFPNRIHTMTLSSLASGILTVGLGVVGNFWLYLFITALQGVAVPIFHTPATVLLQEKVESEFHGRVFGVLVMISSAMAPLGMLVFGPMADMMPIEWLLIGTGVLLFVEGFFMIGSRALLQAGNPAIQ